MVEGYQSGVAYVMLHTMTIDEAIQQERDSQPTFEVIEYAPALIGGRARIRALQENKEANPQALF